MCVCVSVGAEGNSIYRFFRILQNTLALDIIMADVAPKKKREGSLEDLSMEFKNGFLGSDHDVSPNSCDECFQSIGEEELISSEAFQLKENESSEIPEERLVVYQYSIIKTLFEKLPIRDLLACAQVCKMWSEVARVVRKQRRNQAFLMLYHPYHPHTKPIVEWFNGLLGHNISDKAKDFVENHLLAPLKDSSGCIFTSYPQVSEQIRPAILDSFKKCYYEPQLIIFFGTISLNSYLAKRFTPRQLYTRHENLFEGIQAIGPCMAAFGTGLVTTVTEANESYTVEMENTTYPMLTGLAIPKVPGFCVKEFNVDFMTASKYKGKVDGVNCKEILNISPDDNVKGIILFHADRRRSSALSDAVYQYLLQNPNVALGGGAMFEIITDKSDDKSSKGCGLIICGDENVKVFSVGMFQKKITSNNEMALARVKNCNFEEEGSFAFMFACNGRGAGMHNHVCNVESNLFRKYFPKTSLIGAFTAGEFIHEYIPGENSQPPRGKKSIEHSFSTVFVIVSIARPPTSPPPHAS
ncbi:unnamed protein product [Allacma fusca]|uniref:F-box domain-containing protein n=1 Tax=Allacma fusca TaxID=39272 RepID=A0A8J2J1L8_9HEXA|nr:unnamed protein product [Allacma fusca]